MAFVAPLLRDESGGIPPRITIVRFVKLLTPEMNDMGESLQKNALDLLVQLGHPLVEICVTFQIQSVDLKDNIRLGAKAGMEEGRLTAA